jgi:cardiolipin synthase (CMP-forming)
MGARGRAPMANDRIATLPNAITVFRAGLTAGTLWFTMGGHNHAVIFGCLWFAAFLDGADGYTARRFNQISRLGVFLDSALDKLLMIAIAAVFWLSDVIPGWLAGIVVVRDTLMVIMAMIGMRIGRAVLVSVIGKFGTLLLFLGLPGFLLTARSFPGAVAVRELTICFTALGLFLYYWSLVRYARRLAHAAP